LEHTSERPMAVGRQASGPSTGGVGAAMCAQGAADRDDDAGSATVNGGAR
jgi:hypothetical protein